MKLPDTCDCNHVNMVDYSQLARRPLAGMIQEAGYICEKCGGWKRCYYTTRLLDEEIKKLERIPPTAKKFMYHFAKATRRSAEIQERAWRERT